MELPKKLIPKKWVNVYEDPITCKKCEGIAELIKRLDPKGHRAEMEYWRVKFQPHTLGDPMVARWINKDKY